VVVFDHFKKNLQGYLEIKKQIVTL
jgi:hypothetical protein